MKRFEKDLDGSRLEENGEDDAGQCTSDVGFVSDISPESPTPAPLHGVDRTEYVEERKHNGRKGQREEDVEIAQGKKHAKGEDDPTDGTGRSHRCVPRIRSVYHEGQGMRNELRSKIEQKKCTCTENLLEQGAKEKERDHVEAQMGAAGVYKSGRHKAIVFAFVLNLDGPKRQLVNE